MAAPYTMIDSITRRQQQRGIADNVFVNTSPVLSWMRDLRQSAGGLGWDGAVGYDFFQGADISPTDDTAVTVTSKDTVTKALYDNKTYRLPVKLMRYEVEENSTDDLKLASLMDTTMKTVIESVNRAWGTKIWTARSAALGFWSLIDIVDDVDPAYGGYKIGGIGYNDLLDSDSVQRWQAYVIRDTTDKWGAGSGNGVPCTVEVFSHIINRAWTILGLKYDLVVTSIEAWESLSNQMAQFGGYTPAAPGSTEAKYGFQTMYINNTAIVADPYAPGITGGKDHEAMFLSKRGIAFKTLPGYDFKFHPEGWRIATLQPESLVNYYYVSGNLGTFERRANARITNLDPSAG